MNEIIIFITGLIIGFMAGWFFDSFQWMKAIDEDEKRRKHPED